MSLLSVGDVAIRFGHHTLLDQVTFTVEPGERWGVVGRNGTGKTTLMDVVRGARAPDSGEVARTSGCRIAVMDQFREMGGAVTVWDAAAASLAVVFELEASLLRQAEAMTAAGESVTEAMLHRYSEDQERFERSGGYQAQARVNAILDGLGFDPVAAHQRRISTLSGGELSRLALAGQLATPADLLILDEPTNHLDLATTAWLQEHLQTLGAAVLLISHDRAFIAAVADHILHLEGGTATAYQSGWNGFIALRTERRLSLERAVRKEGVRMAAEEDFIRRNIAGQKSAQARGRRRRLERVQRLTPPPDAEGAMAVEFDAATRGGDQLLVVDKLMVSIGERQLIAPWSGVLRRGEVVGLVGPNGTGKSTLLATLLGERPASGGSVRLMPAVEVAFFRQDLSDVDPEAPLYDLIANRRGAWSRGQVQGHLGRFGFSGDEVFRRAGTLSGGERARMALALMMLKQANLLVFDEPTNHLDIESIEALEDALESYGGTVLLVSHDRALLENLTTRTWAVHDGELHDHPGGFADWEADHAERIRRSVTVARENRGVAVARERQASERDQQKSAAAVQRRNARQLAEAESRVESLEAELARLGAELADPALYLDIDGVMRAEELAARQAVLREELATAMAAWEEIAASRTTPS